MWGSLFFLALISFVVSSIITLPHILAHLAHFNKPEFQNNICKILILVLFISLSNLTNTLSFEILRFTFMLISSLYTCYIVYCFLELVIKYTGSESKLLINLEMKDQVKYPWPLYHIFGSFRPSYNFFNIVKVGLYQFMIVNSAYLFFANFLSFSTIYEFLGISAIFALVCFSLLYNIVEDLIETFNAPVKFICIIGVVILPALQKSVFGMLNSEISKSIEVILLSVEMIAFSMLNRYAFNYEELQDDLSPILQPIKNSIVQNIKYLFTSESKKSSLI
ncbi:unnamed protein product [Blepharisma stoltei]|uniref:Uncharacterized protein n=1 Tax=Blepharisma stoltei TaxID=1481888 RepID=A0AAU9IK63_9CILI|nr:unnamed protein product [Blepharisma stoltei]